MERSEAAADESLAAIRARIKLGIAIAAMIRMMATTISSSISEKPFWFRISFFPSFYLRLDVWVTDDAVGMIIALAGPKQIVTLGSVPLRKTALFSVEADLWYQFYGFRSPASCQNASPELTIRVNLQKSVSPFRTPSGARLAPSSPSFYYFFFVTSSQVARAARATDRTPRCAAPYNVQPGE